MGGKRITPAHRNRDFTKEEIEILSLNSNIKNVSAEQINYTDAFKIHFLEQYQAGKSLCKYLRRQVLIKKYLGKAELIKRRHIGKGKQIVPEVRAIKSKDILAGGLLIAKNEL